MKPKPLASAPDRQPVPSPNQYQDPIEILQGLLDSIPNGMFTLDTQYRYLAFNRTHAQQMLAAYSSSIELGQSHLEYIAAGPERNSAQNKLDQALGGKGFVKRDFGFSRAHPTEVFDIHYSPVNGGSGEVVAVQIQFENVSQRSRAEAELQTTQKRFETLFEQSNDAVFILSLEGKHLDCNHRATELLGYSREELLALSLYDVSAEIDQSLADVERLLSGESLAPYERFFRTKSGEVIPVELNVEMIRDGQGKPALIQSVVRNIAERKLAEQKLRENEEKYRSIVYQAVEAITLTDEEGLVIEWNPSAEELTRIPASEVLGQSTWDIQMRILPPALQTPLYRELARQRIEQVLKTGSGPMIGSFESEIKRSDTESVFVRQMVFAIKTSRGYRIGTITHDITAAKKAERELRESEQRYRLLFENMAEGFSLHEIITDENDRAVDFRILGANAAYQRHTGLDPAVVIGKTLLEVIPQADPLQIESYGKVALTGEPLIYEYYSKTFNRYVRVHAFSPKHRQFATIFEDVTSARQAEEQLKHSEERFSTVFHSSHDAISISRLSDGIYLDVNEAFCSIFEISREDVIGHTPNDLALWLNPEERAQLLKNITEQGDTGAQEAQYQTHSGKTGLILVSGAIARIAGQDCLLLFGKDITAYRQAEQALRESNERFNRAFRASPIGIEIFDLAQERLVDVNDTFLAMTGYSRQELLGWSSADPAFTVDPGQIAHWKPEFFARRIVHNAETAIYTKTGELRHLLFSLEPFELNQKSMVMLLCVDITSRKQAEATLKAAHEELEKRVQERTAELQVTNRELEKALRAKNEFMSAMSHELRTPLTGILGLAQVLQIPAYGILSEKQLRAVENIDKSGQRLLELVNNVLDFSMLQSGTVATDLTFCSLEQVWMNIQQSIALLTTHKQQRVHFSMLPERIYLQIDEQRLHQILGNLLNNASKFTPIGGELGLDVFGDPATRQVHLTVWDKGIGIAEPDLERIFQPFVQLDAGLSRRYEGTGLGLALAKSLCELLGGSIHVESTPGKGSRFTVTLPWKE